MRLRRGAAIKLLAALSCVAAIAACDRVVDLTPAPDAHGADGSPGGGDGGRDAGGSDAFSEDGGSQFPNDSGAAPDV